MCYKLILFYPLLLICLAAWEVIEALELFEIPVVSLVSDGAKPNRRFYNLCQVDQQAAAGVPYKTTNPFRQDSELYFFCDAPHLLKTTRNCFSNSFAHSQSRKLKVIWLKQGFICVGGGGY